MKNSVQFRTSKGWLILIILQILVIPVMGLALVWSGIEKTDTSYFISVVKSDVREKEALRAKLSVERERLLSPFELRQRANKFGMREPISGQIRRMESK